MNDNTPKNKKLIEDYRKLFNGLVKWLNKKCKKYTFSVKEEFKADNAYYRGYFVQIYRTEKHKNLGGYIETYKCLHNSFDYNDTESLLTAYKRTFRQIFSNMELAIYNESDELVIGETDHYNIYKEIDTNCFYVVRFPAFKNPSEAMIKMTLYGFEF